MIDGVSQLLQVDDFWLFVQIASFFWLQSEEH